jgi:hypothetical protein
VVVIIGVEEEEERLIDWRGAAALRRTLGGLTGMVRSIGGMIFLGGSRGARLVGA